MLLCHHQKLGGSGNVMVAMKSFGSGADPNIWEQQHIKIVVMKQRTDHIMIMLAATEFGIFIFPCDLKCTDLILSFLPQSI